MHRRTHDHIRVEEKQALFAGPLAKACGKTTVFLHAHFTARAPFPPECLRFNRLVQKNNVREVRADMSQAHRSHRLWVWTDVRELFSESVGSWPHVVIPFPLAAQRVYGWGKRYRLLSGGDG
jgi:hypothetical protein